MNKWKSHSCWKAAHKISELKNPIKKRKSLITETEDRETEWGVIIRWNCRVVLFAFPPEPSFYKKKGFRLLKAETSHWIVSCIHIGLFAGQTGAPSQLSPVSQRIQTSNCLAGHWPFRSLLVLWKYLKGPQKIQLRDVNWNKLPV